MVVRCCLAVGGGALLLRYGETGGARLSACSSDRVDQHAAREVVARAGGGEGVRGEGWGEGAGSGSGWG